MKFNDGTVFKMLSKLGKELSIGANPYDFDDYQGYLSKKFNAPVFAAFGWCIIDVDNTNKAKSPGTPNSSRWIYVCEAYSPKDFDSDAFQEPELTLCTKVYKPNVIGTNDCVFLLTGRGRLVKASPRLFRLAFGYAPPP